MSQWQQGDTLPDMVVDCYNSANQRPDLTQATSVTVKVYGRNGLAWERPVDVVTTTGTATVHLTPDDTATVGTYKGKIFAVFPNGQQHYPPGNRYFSFTVTR